MAIAAVCVGFSAGSSSAQESSRKDETSGQKALDLLGQRCFQCHGQERQRGGLRLDSRQAALAGGESGKPAIVPGRSAESRLVELIATHDASRRMPFRQPPLTADQVATVRRWIDDGAEWPDKRHDAQQQPATVALAVLRERCISCHGPASAMGGLRLDSRAAAVKGGASGSALTPGSSTASLLVERIVHPERRRRMPPGMSLADDEVAAIVDWVDRGAEWPEQSAAAASAKARVHELQVTGKDRSHWAFRPLPLTVTVPVPRRSDLVRTPVDAFIIAAQEARGLHLAPSATGRELVRRASFGLTGLPPAPEDTERFLADRSATAWESLIDRLLASPRFGERWARHWLDLARYADSDGYESDRDRNQAFPYRDFVIRAWNEDMPYDQFVRWQLAGDELDPANPSALAATGFLAAGPNIVTAVTDSKKNKERYRYDELDDFVATTGSAMLSLTVGCARCHDHKYDPIPARDYYGLVAAFANARREVTYLSKPHRDLKDFLDTKRAALREQKMEALALPEETRELLRPALLKNNPTQRKAYASFDGKLQFSEDEFQAWLTPADRAALDRLQKAVSKAGEKPESALVVRDSGPQPAPAWLLGRGNPDSKLEAIAPGFLTVLSPSAGTADYLSRARRHAADEPTSYRRSALAEWITDVEHGAGGLLARAIVNRLWQYHFGEALVRTSGDFGLQGDTPAHPQLLDWLARELIRGGWRLKPVHRLIMNSTVYRLSTKYDKQQASADPENRTLSRRRPMRLEAEALRDAMLAATGTLNTTMYGPAFKPPVPKAAMATRSNDLYPSEAPDSADLRRRSVYMFIKRSVRYPFTETFDGADVNVSCSRRTPTVVPTQALALMNDEWVRARAGELAGRLMGEAGADAGSQVALAFQLLFAREPEQSELARSIAYLNAASNRGVGQRERLTNLCHSLFLLNEFQYVN